MPGQVCVIVVNYRRPHDTLACLESLRQAGALSVLVVDNGSQDESADLIQQGFPSADLLALPDNRGFAGGYNAGIAHAMQSDADAFLLLNNDTLVGPQTLGALQPGLVEWDIVVPKICYAGEPRRIWAAGARWRRFPPAVVMIGYRRRDQPRYNQAGPLEYATGCALLVGRRVFEAIGGFDELYENYLEDYDFCHRARAAGFRIGYVPAACILHKVSQTLGEGSPRKHYWLGRNSMLFYRRSRQVGPAALWTIAGWLLLREALKGNLRLLPHAWRGIRDGAALASRHANRRLP